jgi:hypothetical protein
MVAGQVSEVTDCLRGASLADPLDDRSHGTAGVRTAERAPRTQRRCRPSSVRAATILHQNIELRSNLDATDSI